MRNRPRIPVPDEDPYSIAGNEIDSSGSSGFGASGIYGRVPRDQMLMQSSQYPPLRREKPPKLPPRGDNLYGLHENHSALKVSVMCSMQYVKCNPCTKSVFSFHNFF